MTKELTMDQRIIDMALRTWDVIGGDVLNNLAEMGDPPVMDREYVIEVVCDASYMKTYGNDEEAYHHWSSLPTYEAKKAAVRKAFLFKRYGF